MPDSLPDPQNPETFDKLELSEPTNKAGGLPAVTNALKHSFKQSGVVRGTKSLLKLNQFKGFDCPSCAWPDPDGERAMTEFCENGAKAVASEATRKSIGREFFAQHSVAELAGQQDYWMDQQGRLTEPLVLKNGASHYEPIEWDDAFKLVAKELNKLESPNEADFYTSGRASNEAAFLYQLFVRMFGTNNLPDCSNMCHESSGVALKETIGVGKGTVSLEDLRTAELIMVVGQNPGTNHPRMLSTLQQAKKNGATIVSINPLREPGLVAFAHPQKPMELMGAKTDLADHFIKIPVNGDQALFQAVAKKIFEAGAVDEGFIAEYTHGFETYRSYMDSVSWNAILEDAGVAMEEIELLADLISKSTRIITCWAMGLTQHRNAVATIQEIVNIHLMRGALGKPGAGLCPVRGHSNVQGDRTMGIWEAAPDSFLDALEKQFNFTSPRKHGHNVVDAIRAMHREKVKVFFALGGNFLSATPDTEYTAEALRKCELTVQVSTKLNRSHLITGKQALILPCLGRSDRDFQAYGDEFVTVENSMGIVHMSQGSLLPLSETMKSEIAIVCGLARATLGSSCPVNWWAFEDSYAKIRAAIEAVIPGFDNFETRVQEPGGFYLPNAVKERKFDTATKKANFTVHELDTFKAEAGQLLLMTIRSHDQYNTTIYGLNDRYRGIKNERRVIFMNLEDMKSRSLMTDDSVDVKSLFKGDERITHNYRVVPYDIPVGSVAMYFPEANVLVPIDHLAKRSVTPASKSVPVDVVRSEG